MIYRNSSERMRAERKAREEYQKYKDEIMIKKQDRLFMVIKTIKQQTGCFTLHDIINTMKPNIYNPNSAKILAILKKMVQQGILQMYIQTEYEYKEIPSLLYKNEKVYKRVPKQVRVYKRV